MKVVLVHNWYGSSAPSGENAVVIAETELLRRNGVDVVEFFRYSDKIRKLGILGSVIGGLATPFNPFSYIAARATFRRERPDVVHVHNFFPLVSPAIFYAASHEGVPVVMTLHNYRIGCGAGLPFRNNSICMKCLDSQSVSPLLAYRCYRNSLIASIPLASMIALHRFLGTWQRKVSLFIALTKFQTDILGRIGLLSPEATRIKPQFMSNPPKVVPFAERINRAVFVGRVSTEKGLDVLLSAWQKWGSDAPDLAIVGDGPDLVRLKAEFSSSKLLWLGRLDASQTLAELQKSKLLVFPSICFEGFPMVIREALACGLPILASDIGPLGELVPTECGRLFRVGDPDSLKDEAKSLFEDQSEVLAEMGSAARRIFDRKYTEDINFSKLLSIYQEAIAHHRQ